jgi:hypothetical protein
MYVMLRRGGCEYAYMLLTPISLLEDALNKYLYNNTL